MSNPDKTRTHNMLALATAKGKEFAHLPLDKEGGLYSAMTRKAVLAASLAAVETLSDLKTLPVEGEAACRLVGAILQAGGCLRSVAGFLSACEAKGWSLVHTSIPDWKGLVGREIKAREKAAAKEAKTVQAAQAVADAAGKPEEGPKGKKGKAKAKAKAGGKKKSDKKPTKKTNAEADKAFLGAGEDVSPEPAPAQEATPEAQEAPAPTV